MRILKGLMKAENPSVKYKVIDRKSFSQKGVGRWICRSIVNKEDHKVVAQLLFFGSRRNVGRAMISFDKSNKFKVSVDPEMRGVPRGEKIDLSTMQSDGKEYKGSSVAKKVFSSKIKVKVPAEVGDVFTQMAMEAFLARWMPEKYTAVWRAVDKVDVEEK